MFFYELSAYGYEDSRRKIYLSEIEYPQSEFEEIVFNVYEKICYITLEKDNTSPCFRNIFFSVDDIIFSKPFDELLEKEYDLIRINGRNLTSELCFSLDNSFDDEYTERIEDILRGLDFNTSCWEEDCSRIPWESDDEKQYLRKDCLVKFKKDWERN